MRALCLVLVLACASTGENNVEIVAFGGRLGGSTCLTPPPHAEAEAELARELVLYWFNILELLPRTEDLGYRDEPTQVCFADELIGAWGLSRLGRIWITLHGPDGQVITIRQSALVHEFAHDVLYRAGMDPDGDHSDPRVWGPSGVVQLGSFMFAMPADFAP